jgi:hypothetical protein
LEFLPLLLPICDCSGKVRSKIDESRVSAFDIRPQLKQSSVAKLPKDKCSRQRFHEIIAESIQRAFKAPHNLLLITNS